MPSNPRLLLLVSVFAVVIASKSHSQETSPIELDAHVRIQNPAEMDQAEANTVYGEIKRRMAEGYALSAEVSAKEYQDWKRFSSAPYLSSGHGNRYVSNYGNRISSSYLELDEENPMPVGSILAKDSFTVTAEKNLYPGALFLMEKLEDGRNPETGNWRYVMILPEGSLFGDTLGDNTEAMDFCHECHQQVENTDFLFGVPARYQSD